MTGAVDAERASDGTHDDLVDSVVAQQQWPLLDDESHQVDCAGHFSSLHSHLLAQLLSALVGVMQQPS